MKALLLASVFAAGGCTGSVGKMSPAEAMWGEPVRPITLPDGRPGFFVSCDRAADYCYERARQACGGNFDVVRREEPDEFVDRSIEVVCKT